MKTLKDMYKAAGLSVPNIKNVKEEYKEKEKTIIELPDNDNFFFSWTDIGNLVKSVQYTIGEIDDIEDYGYSDETLVKNEIIFSSKIEGVDLEKSNNEENAEIEQIKADSVKALESAYFFLEKSEQIDIKVLNTLKDILNPTFEKKMVDNEKDDFRNDSVGIYKKENGVDVKIHDGVNHKKIKGYMEVILSLTDIRILESNSQGSIKEGFSSGVLDPIFASFVYTMFEYVHPYFDGNGRLGRMLMYMQMKKSPVERFSHYMSQIIENNKSKYYSSLEHSQKTKNLIYHAVFIQNVAARSLTMSYIVLLSRLMTNNKLTNIQIKFLQKLLILDLDQREVVYADVKSSFPNRSKQSWFKMMNKLVETGVLKSRKTERNTFYKVDLNKIIKEHKKNVQ